MTYLKENILKLLIFLIIGEGLVLGAMLIESEFLVHFLDAWGLRLPIIILAIFIAANTAIVGRLLDLTEKTKFSFSVVYDELRRAFIEQVVIIGLILLASILTNSKLIISYWPYWDELFTGVVLAGLIYDVWLVFEVGISIVKLAKGQDRHIRGD